MTYTYAENVLPLSHDEVVYGKKISSGAKCHRTNGKIRKFRLLYSYMFAHPGTKLLFMEVSLVK
jgi:1,4-alpha-glucan branching enzyme